MRILLLASYSPSLRNFRGSLIEDLIKSGYQVYVGAPGLDSDFETKQWLEHRGVSCYNIRLSRNGVGLISDFFTLLSLYNLIRSIGPNYVLSYTIKPVIWGCIAARVAQIPNRIALITGLGYAFTPGTSKKRTILRILVGKLYKLALHNSTLILFQNPDDRADFLRWGIITKNHHQKIVPGSGVDTERFSPRPFPEGPLNFLMIARLIQDKGIKEYVESSRLIKKGNPDTTFHLVGALDTNPGGLTEDTVRQWEKEKLLTWHGEVPDVRPFIEMSHIFVLPSYREGIPRTVLEAMSMGRPIITTDTPGCRETVRDSSNGYLVPARDPNALARAMKNFLCSPCLIQEMGLVSRKMAVQKYDVRKVNSLIINSLKEPS